jgi:hypothetical protein
MKVFLVQLLVVSFIHLFIHSFIHSFILLLLLLLIIIIIIILKKGVAGGSVVVGGATVGLNAIGEKGGGKIGNVVDKISKVKTSKGKSNFEIESSIDQLECFFFFFFFFFIINYKLMYEIFF